MEIKWMIEHVYMMKSPYKTQKYRVLENFQVSEHIPMPGGWHTLIPWGKELLHSGPLQTLPYVLLHLAVHLYLYHILYYITNR